jgi:glycine dehydrogenase
MAIRAYHASRRRGHRSICLIPLGPRHQSGQRPVMAGMTGGPGRLRRKRQRRFDRPEGQGRPARRQPRGHHGDLPIHPRCVRVIDTRHLRPRSCPRRPGLHGWGQHERAGRPDLARPVRRDVSHLNLHKTFCIPHGGGGPGVGPSGSLRISPLPARPSRPRRFRTRGRGLGGKLWQPDSGRSRWVYIRMMGGRRTDQGDQGAILNANYIARQPRTTFPGPLHRANGRVAHECIIDLRAWKEAGHRGGGCGQAPDGLRVPRAHHVVPGRRAP